MVLIDDFGWSSNADDAAYSMSDNIRYIYARPDYDGTLLSFWFRAHSNWETNEKGRAAVFVSSTRALVAQTSEFYGKGQDKVWVSGNFGASSITANTDYILALWGEGGTKSAYRDSNVASTYWYDLSRDYVDSGSGDFSTYLDPFDADVGNSGPNYQNGVVGHSMEFFVSYRAGVTIEVTNNGGATSVGHNSATINGKITDGSGTVWFCWGDDDAGATFNGWDYSSNNGTYDLNDTFSSGLTGLTAETTYYYQVYCSSNWDSVSDDWLDATSTFTTTETPPNPCDKDLRIYYGDMGTNDFICCNCSRWDVQDYSVVIETWIKKSDLQNLVSNITPGAVGELYRILGKPRYYDKTWSGDNTIKLSPNSDHISNLKNMRSETLIFPKNISYHPIPGPSEWIEIKIEGYLSGQGSL